ncbi:ATP synthase F0 subunit 8 (mitochondrion) [Acyrthosiphon pisum]|uniref:ATP synthase F0 subunit 8 n=1 Tax=Acyrthosiphon pisum TaxID=7029 RepID=B7TYB6_ACYPI|nr:ATP synthase F0 subunit 8 [Acyrthosiphon pisum]ACJ23579.1 ATP synthase F0 subunit 8 [Acyrthosiphon pisum]|eukprot:YP_002323933.1 ATP synthase F0 subunit 8 (mitochondrion) [Acyrthosiphon pisum]
MAPINWLILFMFFFSMFYLIMNLLYFNFIKNIKMKIMKMNNTKNYNKFI